MYKMTLDAMKFRHKHEMTVNKMTIYKMTLDIINEVKNTK